MLVVSLWALITHGLLSVVSGALPMIKPTTEWYTVGYERNGFPHLKAIQGEHR
jgi:hypothetical protein